MERPFSTLNQAMNSEIHALSAACSTRSTVLFVPFLKAGCMRKCPDADDRAMNLTPILRLRRLHLPPPLEGMSERGIVGEFEIAAHRNALRYARHFCAKRPDNLPDIHGRGFAVGIGIRRDTISRTDLSDRNWPPTAMRAQALTRPVSIGATRPSRRSLSAKRRPKRHPQSALKYRCWLCSMSSSSRCRWLSTCG